MPRSSRSSDPFRLQRRPRAPLERLERLGRRCSPCIEEAPVDWDDNAIVQVDLGGGEGYSATVAEVFGTRATRLAAKAQRLRHEARRSLQRAIGRRLAPRARARSSHRARCASRVQRAAAPASSGDPDPEPDSSQGLIGPSLAQACSSLAALRPSLARGAPALVPPTPYMRRSAAPSPPARGPGRARRSSPLQSRPPGAITRTGSFIAGAARRKVTTMAAKAKSSEDASLVAAAAALKPFSSIAELQERWGVSAVFVRRKIWAGEIKGTRFGRAVRVAASEVLRYEAAQAAEM